MSNNEMPILAPAVPAPAPRLPPPYSITVLGPNAYHATLDISRLTPQYDEFASVFLWLSTLTNKDTVKLTFTDTGLKGSAPFIDHLALINCIMICSAKTIAVIDRMYLEYDCYFIMACKAVEVTEFGLLGVPSVYTAEVERLSEKEEAVALAADQLIANAVSTLKILTPEEADQLTKRTTVYVQPEELQARVSG